MKTGTDLKKMWIHAKDHGVENFPWACRICQNVFFISKKLKEHWAEKHPGIKNPKDIVHPDCGCHYSYLESSK